MCGLANRTFLRRQRYDEVFLGEVRIIDDLLTDVSLSMKARKECEKRALRKKPIHFTLLIKEPYTQ